MLFGKGLWSIDCEATGTRQKRLFVVLKENRICLHSRELYDRRASIAHRHNKVRNERIRIGV